MRLRNGAKNSGAWLKYRRNATYVVRAKVRPASAPYFMGVSSLYLGPPCGPFFYPPQAVGPSLASRNATTVRCKE